MINWKTRYLCNGSKIGETNTDKSCKRNISNSKLNIYDTLSIYNNKTFVIHEKIMVVLNRIAFLYFQCICNFNDTLKSLAHLKEFGWRVFDFSVTLLLEFLVLKEISDSKNDVRVTLNDLIIAVESVSSNLKYISEIMNY